MNNKKPVRTKPKQGRIARRATLTFALWLGFWVLSIGLVCGLIWIPFAQLHYRSSLQLTGMIAGLAAISLAYSLRPRKLFWRKMQQSEPLTREQAPIMYTVVEKIAQRLNVEAEVHIHLISTATAYISCKRNWKGKIISIDVGLGLPLFGTLTDIELCSVIAHEFGHFIGGDLALGPWVYRTRMSIAHTVAELDNSLFFLDHLFGYYGKFFLRLSSSVSRAQELAADDLAAKTFGIPSTRQALEKIHLIDPMWSAYIDHELGPAISRGARMPIFEGFRRFCKPSVKRAGVQLSIKRAETHYPSETDSHPSLEERVAALVPGAKPAFPPLAHCWELLGGERAAEDAWYALFEPGQLAEFNWDEFGDKVLEPQIRDRFHESWMDPSHFALENLVQLADRPEDIWDKLKPEGISLLSPQAKRNYVLEILEEWIVACLCYHGYKIFAHPGQALVLLRAGKECEGC